MPYHERLWPTPWWYLAGLPILPAVALVFAPLNLPVGVILACACYGGYLALLFAGSTRIEVGETQLRVGSARIPLVFTGRTVCHEDRDAARRAAGPELDARAWICLRGWVRTSVRIEIVDDNDPTPYWLVSTRDPRALADAIERGRSRAGR